MPSKDRWWLSVEQHIVGTTHKSLTQKLLFSRYIVCQTMITLKTGGYLTDEVRVTVMKNGEVQAEDVF